MTSTQADAKVALVSFRMPDDLYAGRRDERRRQLQEVFDAALAADATHVLLPGWTLLYRLDELQAGEPGRDVAWLAGASRGLSVVAEQAPEPTFDGFRSTPEGLGIVAIDRGQVMPARVRQQFAEASQVSSHNGAYARVAGEVFAGVRTVTLGGVRFLILVCGETGLLRNVQSEGNRVEMRHVLGGGTLDALRLMDHHAVYNPGHTPMGNQGKMQRRWSFLSEPPAAPVGRSRYCLYTTNTFAEDRSAGTSMYAFRDGHRLPMKAKWDWRADRPWAVEYIDLHLTPAAAEPSSACAMATQ